MAKASRSKKQPEFDAHELDDLIFSPAVGSGVGSHLLSRVEPSGEPNPPKNAPNVPTIVTLKNAHSHGLQPSREVVTNSILLQQLVDVSTVASLELTSNVSTVPTLVNLPTIVTITELTTVDMLRDATQNVELDPLNRVDMSTVDTHTQPPTVDSVNASGQSEESHIVKDVNVSTVDTSTAAAAPPAEPDRFEDPDVATVAMSPANGAVRYSSFDETPKPPDMPTMDRSKPGAARFSSRVKLWQTADGELVPDGRVKQIRRAQDVINSAEESVYNTLWRDPNSTEEGSARIVQAGYNYLVRQTRLARKTIQRIIAKLIDKGFIEIAKPADIYQRTSTVYRVFNYRTVLDRHETLGRKHVAKVGPGFSYVWELSDQSRPATPDLSTVATSSVSTVVNESTVTVVKMNLSTVVRETTSSIDNSSLGQTSSSSEAIYQALSHFGAVDDDALRRLRASCREWAPDCSDDEIVHFIREKGELVRAGSIRTPIGFLMTAVPKCFMGESFQHFRAEQGRLRKQQAEAEERAKIEAEEWRREQQRMLLDPATPDDHKAMIREWLGVSSEKRSASPDLKTNLTNN